MVAVRKWVDPVEYPETDNMGEHEVHLFITLLLLPLVTRLFAERRRVARVSGNQFIYWEQGNPKKACAPDLYVIDGVSQDAPDRSVWKTWEGTVPVFALEVVSDEWKKDYARAPEDYDAMGVKELVVFDPWATARSRKRLRWQVFRRARGRGLVRVPVEQGDRIESIVLGCFLRVVDDKGRVRLRVGMGPDGDTLMPTDAEAAAAMQVVVQITGSQTEAERAARQEAEAEIVRLRAEIERLRRG